MVTAKSRIAALRLRVECLFDSREHAVILLFRMRKEELFSTLAQQQVQADRQTLRVGRILAMATVTLTALPATLTMGSVSSTLVLH